MEHNLQELSEKTGFEKRTIRYFITEGLMLGPESFGRNARYSDYHLNRLYAIRYMRDQQGLSLPTIRQRLILMPDNDVERIAGLCQTVFDSKSKPESQAPTALDYIRQIKQQSIHPNEMKKQYQEPQVEEVQNFQISCTRTVRHTEDSSSEHGSKLDNHNKSRGQSQPKAFGERGAVRNEQWNRIEILPDIELHIRGIQTDEERTNFENIALLIRDYLLGGKTHV